MIGQTVSHFRIQSKLGEGGMGVVYRAEDTRLGRSVALKFLPSRLTGDAHSKARFIREAQIAGALDHPNVCTIYEIDETDDGQLFICMAYCPGRSLLEQLDRGPLSAPEAVRVTRAIAHGLSAAHEHGIVHRDIKPSNVMISETGEVKILDFGIAKSLGLASLTATHTAVGTLAYMAPEQAEGKPIDQRCDIWALGIVLYESLTGVLPFRAETAGAMLNAICNKEPEPLPRSRDVPPALHAVIDRCLVKDPDGRYQRVDDVLNDLLRLGSAADPVAPDPESSESETGKRFPWIHVLVLLAVVAFAVSTLVALQRSRSPSPPGAGAPPGGQLTLAILSFENLQEPEDQERLGQILQELLIINLSETASLRVLSSERLFDVRKQLGYGNEPAIAHEIVEQVSRAAGASILLRGRIIRLGDEWTLTGQLVDLESGTVYRAQRIDGSNLFAMVGELATKIREDLDLPAEPGRSVSVALGDRTSSSLEAWRHYFNGLELLYADVLDRAIAEFRAAVAVDSTFNEAWHKLALAQWWSDDVATDLGRASIARILDNRQYVSDRDRQLAEGALALIDRRYSDATATYEAMAREYPDDKEVHYALGLAYSAEVDALTHEQALAAFMRAREIDPTFVLARRQISHMLIRQRRCEEALDEAEQLVRSLPESPVSYRYIIDATVCLGDTARVERAITQALTHHHTSEEVQRLYFHVGSAYARVRDEARAESYTRRALAANPETGDYRIWAQLGDGLYNQGKLQEAEEAWVRCLEINPLSSWCLGGLWYVAWTERDHVAAIDYATRLVEMRPQSPRRHGELIESYVRALRYAEADQALEEGLVAIPSEVGKVDLLSRVADVCRGQYRREKAREVLQRATERAENHAGICAQLAIMDCEERLYDSAIQQARRALAIAPDDQWSQIVLFHALLYSGQVEAARAAAKRFDAYGMEAGAFVTSGVFARADSVLAAGLDAVQLNTTRRGMLSQVGDYYRGAGEYERAEALYRRALKEIPGDGNVLNAIALACELQGKYDDAEAIRTRPLDVAEYDPRPYQSLGRLALRRGRVDEAERWYRRALAIEDTNPVTQRELACVYTEQGRFPEARTLAEQAMARDPSHLSFAVAGWTLVAGDIDLDNGLRLGHLASTTPPLDDPLDRYVQELPFVPLPEQVIAVAHLKRGETDVALPYLETACQRRPQDPRLSDYLRRAREAAGE